MIREIVKKGSDVLRTKCSVVTDFESVQGIIGDITDTIEYLKTTYPFGRGVALAAPQIGETVRISVAEYSGERYVLINPEIVETSGDKKPIWEGCISFFEYRASVPRYDYVKVRAFNQKGEEYLVEGRDDFAMLLQHEVDHLNGILYIDRLPNGEKDLVRSDDV